MDEEGVKGGGSRCVGRDDGGIVREGEGGGGLWCGKRRYDDDAAGELGRPLVEKGSARPEGV